MAGEQRLSLHVVILICNRVNKEIGSGQFGTVYKGVWLSGKGEVEVAVKTLKEGSGKEDKKVYRYILPCRHLAKPEMLLSYCRQVASGMAYLSRKAFVHRNLAAKNILVSQNNLCKVTHYGGAYCV